MGQATDFLCTKAGFLDPGLTERKDLPHLQLSNFEIRICFNHYFIIKNQIDQEAMSVFHPVVFFFFTHGDCSQTQETRLMQARA